MQRVSSHSGSEQYCYYLCTLPQTQTYKCMEKVDTHSIFPKYPSCFQAVATLKLSQLDIVAFSISQRATPQLVEGRDCLTLLPHLKHWVWFWVGAAM